MPKPEKHVFICSQARPAGHPRGSCAEPTPKASRTAMTGIDDVVGSSTTRRPLPSW